MFREGRENWRPSDFVRAIRCGLPRRLARRRLLMPVRAFVDDSGSGGDSRYYVLGGFMADFETWESFSDGWDKVLRQPPAIAYFKMMEAHNLRDEFSGWSTVDRDTKVGSLIDVILSHDLFQGSCAVDAHDYEQVVRPVLGGQWKGQYDDPYLYLFMGIVGHFAAMENRWEYAQRHVPDGNVVMFDNEVHTGSPPQLVDFVFDNDQKHERPARKLYEESLRKLRLNVDRLGSVDFKDDKLLHAASGRRPCGMATSPQVVCSRGGCPHGL